MNADHSTSTQSSENVLITTAFLLGWSISELLGHVRKGMRPSAKAKADADYSARLVVSNGAPEKETDAFMLAAQRIVQFYQQLGFEPGEHVSTFTEMINALPGQARDWVEGKTAKFYSQGELRELLNEWSLQVWARLEGISAESARAFNSGMSLADTYWYMRLPTRRPVGSKSGKLSEENWTRLLSKYRLEVERSRLRGLQNYLPRYVADVIYRHLEEWSIGTELKYQDNKLVRVKGSKKADDLRLEDETRLQRNLERQAQNWEAMLFGLREATTFLHARDRWLIRIGRWVGLFVAQLLTALLLFANAAVVGYLLSISLLPVLLRFLNERQAGIGDLVTVVSLLWTVLIAVPVPIILRAAYQFTRGAQRWLDDQLTIYFIARRTYVVWDRYLKG